MKKKSRLLLIAIIAVVILLFALVGFLTDLLWFQELGYISVFFKQLVTELEFGVPAFIIITLVCYFYLMAMKKGYYRKIGAYDMGRSEKAVNRWALAISAVFGLIAAFSIANKLWFQILQFVNSTDFNIADPVFGRDVSFYIFKLDFISSINNILIGIIIGFAAVNLIYYITLLKERRPAFLDEETRQDGTGQGFGGMFGQMFGDQPNPFGNYQRSGGLLNRNTLSRLLNIASSQLKVLGVLFLLMLALHYFLKQFSLLYTSSSGVVYGAGYADINIQLWVYRLLIALSLLGAIWFLMHYDKRKLKPILMIPAALLAVSIVGGVVTMLVQNLIVEPDELNKEQAYLQNNIAFTRYAYDLQDIQIRDFAAKNNLTAEDIKNNTETISNIRINDYEPALKFYNQTQSIRLYYKFNDVDVDRYMVNGDYTQAFLSAREIDESAVNDQWLTTHIKYTHGYGVTLSRVDKVTESGQPDMLIHNIPPVSDVAEIGITRPEIYFGELTNSYVVVNTDEPEFDYPSGESNVYTEYEGDAGIRLNFFNRILFALRERSLKLLVSTNINSDSRILINRNVIERVGKITPFLAYDEDPYIVTTDGGLYWIFDAYTTSSYYPYSEPFAGDGSINYIRNSVKVVINAYDGTTDFYIVDPDDPIAITLQKIYPKLFKNIEEMPEGLKAHLRYPNTMFTIQANVYQKYHMTDVNVFYQNEDGWNIAKEIYGTEEVYMTPTYYIMKLPGEGQAEFINSIPYTPSGKDNMISLLVARNDGEYYGDLVLYQMPKGRTIYGPRQVESLINQDTEISQDFTLWNSSGSTYIRGNMFTIPIEDSLMYVEPIYLESSNSSLPEVKRVIIYYNERIAYESTLAQALDSMFGEGASSGFADTHGEEERPEGADLTFEEIALKANQAYENAVKSQQQGDWAAYGRYLTELQDYLQQLIPEQETPAEALEGGAAEEAVQETPQETEEQP